MKKGCRHGRTYEIKSINDNNKIVIVKKVSKNPPRYGCVDTGTQVVNSKMVEECMKNFNGSFSDEKKNTSTGNMLVQLHENTGSLDTSMDIVSDILNDDYYSEKEAN